MKLYNKTKCPDSILRPLLLRAGKSIGANTSGVVVKVTQGQSPRTRGVAYKCFVVYSWHLHGRRKKSRTLLGQQISTNGGFIQISLPGPHPAYDKIVLAQRFYTIMQHEWAHIKQYQSGQHYATPRTVGGRRIAHDLRPAEKDAYKEVMFAKKLDSDDLVLALALYLEENGQIQCLA